MPLTEEQRERIRVNRERALEIQRQRRQQQTQEKQQNITEKSKNTNNKEEPPSKRVKYENEVESTKTGEKVSTAKAEESNAYTGPLEVFEEDASEWITKQEAKAKYCVPDGTLAVCETMEKPNPHNPQWTPMKLYRRSEIRRRAHKRFGGLEGLIHERNKREEARLEKDLQRARDEIFSSTSSADGRKAKYSANKRDKSAKKR